MPDNPFPAAPSAAIQQRVVQVQHALRDPQPPPFEELLIPRDDDGTIVRAMQPPAGVRPRAAAALILLYPHADDLWLPLTVRSAHLPNHRGEVSLPGGATDPEDGTAEQTALRETHEEIGVPPAGVEVWGRLRSIYIPPSNFELTPVVGYQRVPPIVHISPAEIAHIFYVPLAALLDPATVQHEDRQLSSTLRARVPYFALEGYKVWGATALVLSDLVARLRRTIA